MIQTNCSELIAECHRFVADHQEPSTSDVGDLIARVHEAIVACQVKPDQFYDLRQLKRELLELRHAERPLVHGPEPSRRRRSRTGPATGHGHHRGIQQGSRV